ncbi:MAG: glycoside hydrolase family 140 protein [Chitinophagaceae bacterium]
MLRLLCLSAALFICLSSFSQLRVSDNKRFLVTKEGKPFFWLGDTAWELFHRLNREDAKVYLQNRAAKGFTVIQAVVLAELDGLETPNAYGDKPLINNDPSRPNEAYFKHVDFIVREADKLGLTIGMLASWGDKWNKSTWGKGPEIFTPANAGLFGEYLGKRYNNNSIIWIMGGDRDCTEPADFAIIRSMVEGLKKGGGSQHLFTFHPQGGKSSSDFFKSDDWIDLHMSQTGHYESAPNYTFNQKHLAFSPLKPHLDGEPRYEDHPNAFNAAEKGWLDDVETRQAAYWSMLSGACGHTYGNHNIWQMFTEERQPVSMARTHWKVALDHPGSYQVGYLRKLLESRAWQRLQPDQEIISGDNPAGKEFKVAAVSADGDFLMAYVPYGRKTTINTAKLKASRLRAWLFNPRDGRAVPIGEFDNTGNKEISFPSVGRGSDWVVVADDAARNYPKPGAR